MLMVTLVEMVGTVRVHCTALHRATVVDALESLLEFAAVCLVVGGRLVYWLPTTADYQPR